MSDQIKHECGIVLIRLRKPLEYYLDKYGTALYGLNKLYLMMQKQHNRGQDGAGVTTIKIDPKPGTRYISRRRSNTNQPIEDIFKKVYKPYRSLKPEQLKDIEFLRDHSKFMGEVLMGHLRYGTHGKNSIEACHPFLRQNNWMTRNLVLAGNFNMTNVTELITQLIDIGQHPKEVADTVTVLEKIGHFLDVENQRLFDQFKKEGYENRDITGMIADNLDIQRILSKSVRDFDGGYTMVGLIGHGDAFVVRDPNGIRPAYYYMDDEVVVAASERPAIQTSFNVHVDEVKEIKPGHALIVKKDGSVNEVQCHVPGERKSCSFERIYFSRGTDKDIYKERKKLGYLLTDTVLEAVGHDLDNTVFSFIPNTAEVAFFGLEEGVNDYIKNFRKQKIQSLKENFDENRLERLFNLAPRVEKLAIKDAKLRTFIADDSSRDELVSHIYDVTYGIVREGKDTIVALDDSIVRGTTLKKSILSIFDRLGPKKIIIVSSAPQIRYPDCYGIDMSRMNDFVAFRAAVELLVDRNKEDLLEEIYDACKAQEDLPIEQVTNQVKRLYELFTDEEISAKISQIIKPEHISAEVEVIYQSIDNLHIACPNHLGDWYFSGDFPTPGGNRVVNRAFINFMEGSNARAY